MKRTSQPIVLMAVFLICVGVGAYPFWGPLLFKGEGEAGSLAEKITCVLTGLAIPLAFWAFRDEQSYRRNEHERNFQGTLLQLATTFYSSESARLVRIALDGRNSGSDKYAELMRVIAKSQDNENKLDDEESLLVARFDEYLNFFNSVAIIASEEQAGDGKEARFAETEKHFNYYLKQLEGDSTDKTILEYAKKHGFEDLVRLLEGIGTLKKAPQ